MGLLNNRGLLQKIFARSPTAQVTHNVKGVNSHDVKFNDWNGNIYDIDIAKSAIHSNASNMAKLSPKHIRISGGNFSECPQASIKKMLERPNPYMNFYDFLYKIATHREEKDNAFIYFDRENMHLYPVDASQTELLEGATGDLFIRFSFRNGQKVVIPFEDMIILRKHFNKNDLFGDNDRSLNSTMETINTVDQGIVHAVKKSANLRGILKWSAIMKPEDVKKQTDEFIKNYLTMNNDGGVASTDPRFEYVPLKTEPYVPNNAQMQHSEDRVYSYFGTNKNIVQCKFSEDEWNAYYENTIEPVAIQLSLEFTYKIFSETEIAHGNKIVFEANRLQYASNKTKVQVCRLLTDVGAASLDQILEIFNMAPIGGEEGQRRVQTLNMVNAKEADKYQLGKEGGEEDE